MGSRHVVHALGGAFVVAVLGVAAPLPAGPLDVSLERLPLRFEPNRGQSDRKVQFLARGSGYDVYLTAAESVFALRRSVSTEAAVLRLSLVGARRDAEAVGVGLLPGRSHYLLGSDARAWRTAIPQYAGVRFPDVYPGIHLGYYGKEGEVEHDFVVMPGADPRHIRFRIEGARRVRLDGDGNLVLSLTGGEAVLHAPLIYQEGEAEPSQVTGRYVRHGRGEIGFGVGPYDRTRPLVIDPVLSYSSYLGGSGSDLSAGVAVDASGSVYLVGLTSSTGFPTVNPLQAGTGGSYDVFVAKLDPSGSALEYSTYLGGSGWDSGLGIAVDSSKNAYITGETSSSDFPTANALQASYGGGSYDAFVAKLDPSGSALVYSTYLGGNGYERGEDVATDDSENAYIAGPTSSTDFPTAHPLQASYGGGSRDAFVVKLGPSGSALTYSTYLGGSGMDYAYGIAADSSGNAYVAGFTQSANFPTASPLQPGNAGSDAFIAKLNPSGSAFVYSTYLGGSGYDSGSGVAADSSGNAYVTGYTYSTDFPTADPLQANLAGNDDVFVAKISATGSALTYSTYLGGSSYDSSRGIALDLSRNVYLTGSTQSTDFPTVDALQPSHAGSEDAFVIKLDASGSVLTFSTYLGGSANDQGDSIAADASGNAYVSGYTASTDFPTASPVQPASAGGNDAILVKISTPMSYYTVTPCRLLDTRGPAGTYGGPGLVAGAERVFPLSGRCAIPATARAVSVNLTITQATSAGNLRLYPAGAPTPSTSSLNYVTGRTRANNAVVSLNGLGELAAYCAQASGTAQLVLDVNGYFE